MAAPPRAVVVGAGFAGIAAAVDLVRRGARVTLLEARRQGGGRASSFVDLDSGETIDNGQHVLLGCYAATRALLETLGTERLVRFQRRLSLAMVEPGGRVCRLRCPPLPAPLHLVAGLVMMRGLTWDDREALVRSARALMRPADSGLTVEGWLDALGYPESLRTRFWRPLAVAALNEDPRVAAAALLSPVLAEAFSGGASASGIGVAACGLSDLYVGPAERFLRERGGAVRTGTPAERIVVDAGRAVAVEVRGGPAVECDAVVLAVPHTAAGILLPREAVEADPRLSRLEELGTSAIVSVNLWLDRPVTDLPFLGLVDGTVQWVFNKAAQYDPASAKASYLGCVISAGSAVAAGTNEWITEAAAADLRRYLPAAREARVLRSMVIREKQATFSGRPGILPLRPPTRTAIPNLALAGDWTATGLPGTIEGAVRSGVNAAHVLAGAPSPPP